MKKNDLNISNCRPKRFNISGASTKRIHRLHDFMNECTDETAGVRPSLRSCVHTVQTLVSDCTNNRWIARDSCSDRNRESRISRKPFSEQTTTTTVLSIRYGRCKDFFTNEMREKTRLRQKKRNRHRHISHSTARPIQEGTPHV